MNITSFSIKNFQFTIVMVIMSAAIGITTLLTMPRAEDPQIYPPIYNIVVVYPGTSPEDIEELVVNPIEKKLYELSDIDKMTSTIQDGLAKIKVDFIYGVDIENKYQEVVREVNALRSQLPAEIFSIDILKVDPSDVSILQIGLVSETMTETEMLNHAEDLIDVLENVSTLKKIEVAGANGEYVDIQLDLPKIAKLKIPLNTILGSIQSENANIPGGRIDADQKTFNVKTSGKYSSLEEISNTVVFNSNSRVVYLRDVANVYIKNEPLRHITRLNGHRCVIVNAALKVGANIALTEAEYSPLLDAYKKSLPGNLVMVTSFDQAKNVAKRLSGLGFDFILAILLVLLTLLPLGFRASFVVMLAIPLSLALGLVGLNYFGISLNQLSIVGLVVALGLLVDDSIVVVENIERWLRDGYSRREAAIKATEQIREAVLGTTATLVIAFLPLIFLPGAPGEFVRGLPLAVITSVIASTLVSLTVVPFLASRMLKKDTHPEGNLAFRLLKKGINATYSKLVTWSLRHTIVTLLIGFGMFGASLTLLPIIGFKLFPVSEKPIFLVNVNMPQQTSLLRGDEIAKMIEDSLRTEPRIKYFTTNVGKGNPRIYYNVPQKKEKYDFAQFFVQLQEDTHPNDKTDIIQNLRKRFETFPHARLEIEDFVQGPPIEAPIVIRIFGEEPNILRQIASDFELMMKEDNETLYVNNDLRTLKTDVKINIDKAKARTLGVLTADIDKTIRLAIAGVNIGTYTNGSNEDYNIVVSTENGEYPTLQALQDIYVNNAAGTAISLDQFASIEFEASANSVNHFNKKRFAKITSNTQNGVLANDVLANLIPLFDRYAFPEGYFYRLAGEAESEDDAFGGNFIVVILITIFLFIAVLILQFKTFKGTIIVLSVIPLGVVGGVTMLFLTGNPMSFIAIIGFIGLAGIEVKNSILLVDFTNQLRREGMHLNEAIETAGNLRFLPVLLTAMTAIGGLTPLALNSNPQISPLALVLIGGLISSTILSRIITPVMYKLIPPEVIDNE